MIDDSVPPIPQADGAQRPPGGPPPTAVAAATPEPPPAPLPRRVVLASWGWSAGLPPALREAIERTLDSLDDAAERVRGVAQGRW